MELWETPRLLTLLEEGKGGGELQRYQQATRTQVSLVSLSTACTNMDSTSDVLPGHEITLTLGNSTIYEKSLSNSPVFMTLQKPETRTRSMIPCNEYLHVKQFIYIHCVIPQFAMPRRPMNIRWRHEKDGGSEQSVFAGERQNQRFEDRCGRGLHRWGSMSM